MGLSYVNVAGFDFVTLLDEQPAVTYVGKAVPGSSMGAPVWQIRRITQSGTTLAVLAADGNLNFDNVWDNRASLVYS